jgi:uncharacterized protein (TIGR02757 family)
VQVSDLASFLEEKAHQYNHPSFVGLDPVSIPHRFSFKEDKEISGLLAATISWGNRTSILKNATAMMHRMDDVPYQFVMQASKKEFNALKGFVHRTFNDKDLAYFILALRHAYTVHGGLEKIFTDGFRRGEAAAAIGHFRSVLFSYQPPGRTAKHVSDPLAGSSAKRLNMYLRWMVRRDKCGVDLGLWTHIDPSKLSIPLDVHTGNVSRRLGLLQRKQNDWKAVAELDQALRQLDPKDPVRFDYALFGLGAIEKF